MRRNVATSICAIVFAASVSTANDLGWLNDEFDDAATIALWSSRHASESLGFDPLERWEIDPAAHPGCMLMQPYSVQWYAGYKGPFVYKEVTGDFVLTTRVTIDNRSGTGVPSSHFSLAGVFIRQPVPNSSTPENYVFLSLGNGDQSFPSNPGPPPHFEVKSTVDGNSALQLSSAGTLTAELQIARIGSTIVTLYRRPNESWTVHQRYQRSFPATMQVGFVTYTDWDKCSSYTPSFHNAHLLVPPISGDPSTNPSLPFNPDLVASFDYAHFFRPIVPSGVDPATASDVQLLSFLGDAANVVVASYCTAGTTSNGCTATISSQGIPSASAVSGFTLSASGVEGQKTGLFFYGLSGPSAAPWGSGSTSFLCVKAPTQRLPAQSSGGTANACDGAISVDWLAHIAAHPSSLGAPFSAGDVVHAQIWFRDPPAPKTTNLSNALMFRLSP